MQVKLCVDRMIVLEDKNKKMLEKLKKRSWSQKIQSIHKNKMALKGIFCNGACISKFYSVCQKKYPNVIIHWEWL